LDLPSAAKLAKDLLADHGLAKAGWGFAFNRRKRVLGLCRFAEKRIELSSQFVMHNGEELVRDTVLHEIAHALAGPEAGHGAGWIRVCEQIGAKPERTCSEASMPKGAYLAVCPSCQTSHSRHRKPMAGRTYFCKTCGPKTGALRFKR